jgi:Archaeal fructose-1,6-bisphosphatase and related enzymes of inositol monophosphatase family
MLYEKELQIARKAAAAAGEIAMRYRAQGVTAEQKVDLSPVTIADRECEKAIAAILHEAFPEDGILGEEGASLESGNARRWIVDPIDGTRDFVRGNRAWANLIALEVDGEVVVGVANLPAMGEMYYAAKGAGAFCNESRIHVSSISSPGEAVVCFNSFNAADKHGLSSKLLDWLKCFWAVRSMGGCLDAVMVASGQADLWLEQTAQCWDLAPLKILVEEAGGRFFNYDGGSSIYGGNCVCCTPALESEARRFLGIG